MWQSSSGERCGPWASCIYYWYTFSTFLDYSKEYIIILVMCNLYIPFAFLNCHAVYLMIWEDFRQRDNWLHTIVLFWFFLNLKSPLMPLLGLQFGSGKVNRTQLFFFFPHFNQYTVGIWYHCIVDVELLVQKSHINSIPEVDKVEISFRWIICSRWFKCKKWFGKWLICEVSIW